MTLVERLPHVAAAARRFDALLLPGGHAPGMREYLESAALQSAVAAFKTLIRAAAELNKSKSKAR